MIKVGATIQAKLGNWKQAYSGEVLGINGDGTFHVKFEDGEVMKHLQKKWIIGGETAKVVKADQPAAQNTGSSGTSQLLIKVGATIKAKLGNWKQAYSGEVLGINGDGTFHVKFEDGEVMKYLQKKWIIGGETAKVVKADQPAAQNTGSSSTSQLVIKVGATIKAKLGNWKQAYSGEVLGINGDGTFHVKFEDGEVMKYLQKKWIIGGDTAKVILPGAEDSQGNAEAPSAGAGGNVLKKGKEIKAKLPNWSQPYNGVVQGVNKDGTVHVKFEDGDEMKYLQKKWIIGGEKMIVEGVQSANGGYGSGRDKILG